MRIGKDIRNVRHLRVRLMRLWKLCKQQPFFNVAYIASALNSTTTIGFSK